MALTATSICNFGWKARDFKLKGVDDKVYTLDDVRGPKGTLVVFICNHCPYVRAVIGRLVEEASALKAIGIGTIAIMPNDTQSYPDDSFENMKRFAQAHSHVSLRDRRDAGGRARLRRAMHARFLWLQHR